VKYPKNNWSNPGKDHSQIQMNSFAENIANNNADYRLLPICGGRYWSLKSAQYPNAYERTIDGLADSTDSNSDVYTPAHEPSKSC